MDNMKCNEMKPNWYNFILEKPWEQFKGKNIQYIIEYDGTYGIASMKPLSLAEVESIDINEWNMKPYKEIIKEWENGRKQDTKRDTGNIRQVQESTNRQEKEATRILYQ